MPGQGYFPYNTPGSPAHTSAMTPTPSSPAFGGPGGYGQQQHQQQQQQQQQQQAQIYSNVHQRYSNHMHQINQKMPAMHSPQLNHPIPSYQQHASHGSGGTGPGNVNSSGGGGGGGNNSNNNAPTQISGPFHQKQIDSALLSRQSAGSHHHARVAAAAARTASANPDAPPAQANARVPTDPNAKPSQWNVLDLGGMQMKNISQSLFNYTFLKALYLSHNAFSTLSPDVTKLVNLVVLDISGNRLSSVPSELGMLVSLRELLLHDNELTFLPPELGQLYQLEVLGLEGNPLNEPVVSMIQKEGTSAVVTYLREMCPVGPPPADREWIALEDEYAGDTKDTFTVMTYNILAEKYATAQQYAYTPSWALSWDYRKDLLLQDILNYNADIICLQEVQMDHYEDFFREQLSQLGGYEGVFYPKSRARTMAEYERRQVDGCATFWKGAKLTLLEKHCVEFQQIAMQKPELRKTDDVFNRVMIKDNVAVVTLLENKQTHTRILTANAHLTWESSYADVKLVQTGMLMEELDRLGTAWTRTAKDSPAHSPAGGRPGSGGAGGSNGAATNGNLASSPTTAAAGTETNRFPLLMCGDLNSLPDSGVYEYLSRGRVPQDHKDFGTYTYGPYTSEGLHHKFSLKSSYSHTGELDFTNFTPDFTGVIDYVWYSTNTLDVSGLLGSVDKDYVARTVGFPNAHHPSDHLPLVVSMRVKSSAGPGGPTAIRFN
ncbi:Glucose-repressible alcohol dehydrogenase transcriptional effector [Thoreauomyces humboldtii]|nr:Glucose-repressible alcohol dehydrogenase transcriptional effector [Thoreauomyces humboldtii]